MNRRFIAACVLLAFLCSGLFYFLVIHESTPRQQTTGITPPDAGIPIRHINPPPALLPVDSAIYVEFSHEAVFFDASFYLEISAPEGAEIFFTLDGSIPGVYATRFTSPLFLYAPSPDLAVKGFARDAEILASRVQAVTVRAIAIRDGSASEAITRNFVMGTDVFTRFCENTLIFALTSDPHGLFDHYEGILVAGVDRERWRYEFTLRHGRAPIYGYNGADENPATPANFNRRGRESERVAYVEMFDYTGVLHISQHIGIRVRGGFSRASEPQKSLELFAREEYGDRNNFAFAFFPDEFTHDGYLIDRYRRVRLRNGGSDRYPAFLRDELSQALFRQAGHSTTQTHRPAAVFLNGEYYGAAWLKTPRTENHLARIFGGNSSQFEIIGGGENRHTSWWDGNAPAVEDFTQVHQLAVQGFTGTGGEARFAQFQQRVDLPELIRYYAMQIYINNLDWPNNNIEFWRYFPTPEEANDSTLHPFLRDGRWRVFAHDLEASWGIWDNYNRRVHDDTLHYILTGSGPGWNWAGGSAILQAFVDREETRQMLAEAFEELINGAFAPHNVEYVLDSLIAQIQNEHEYMIKMDGIGVGNDWWPTPYSVAESRDAIRYFAHHRPQAVRDMVRRHLSP
ncbi:MAG: CotH kinase family protein [Defluviitaleaceae bacterium]|nr:CotH kinase family protein [Defluviitaleaceae bacterium]MCL2273896.1 CotH kinase family protein [Defluviitaleaceae bacterium]